MWIQGHEPPYVYTSLNFKNQTNSCMFSTFSPAYHQWSKIFIWSKREQNTYSLIRDQYDCFVIQERSLQNYLSHLFSPLLACLHKNCWQKSVFVNYLCSIDSLLCDIWGIYHPSKFWCRATYFFLSRLHDVNKSFLRNIIILRK